MKSINILDLHESEMNGLQIKPPEAHLASSEANSGGTLASCSLLAYSSLQKSVKNEENANANANADANAKKYSEVSDVHALLAQKEKDLILAAELGKALLEKNEDLSQHNEKMAEDFSKQLEVRNS